MPSVGPVGFTKLQLVVGVVGVLVAAVVGAVVFGLVGAPSVEDVDNRFGDVDEETTVIETDLLVNNPNPIGIRLGNTTISYTVRMNDVPMATGGAEDLNLQVGNSTQSFQTQMNNTQIPSWWVTHIDGGERTVVTIDATVDTSILGERQFNITQKREIETDIIGELNSEETQPVTVDDPPPLLSNPVLYVNQTSAGWGTVTDERTPIEMEFLVYNPQDIPYTVTEVGYEITMNDVPVGEGKTDRPYAILPGDTQTIGTTAEIINPSLDEWWVTHLQNDQVTELRIEFYAVLSVDGLTEDIRLPLDELTYEETIETDIFDNKDDDRTPGETTPTPTPTPTPDGPLGTDPLETPEDPLDTPEDPLGTSTPDDGGGLL